MHQRLRLSLSASLLVLLGANLNAAVLAYDGFATDATGSGVNYTEDANLEGVDKARTGFQGAWFDGGGQGANRNVRADLGNLNYSGFVSGTDGLAVAFNNDTVQSTSSLNRNLDITDASVSSGYYVALLIDYSGSEGGFVFSGESSENSFIRSGSNVTWGPAGGSSTGGFTDTVANLGISDTEPNLIVVQYTTDQTGAPNNFYSRWNLWINPDLSGGSLGSVTATGMGIGLYDGAGAIAAPSTFGLSNARINDGASSLMDEVYFATSPTDFVIPEPSTWIGIAVIGALVVAFRRRK